MSQRLITIHLSLTLEKVHRNADTFIESQPGLEIVRSWEEKNATLHFSLFHCSGILLEILPALIRNYFATIVINKY